MEVLYQIGKEIGELRSRLEAIERRVGVCVDPSASVARRPSGDRPRVVAPEPLPSLDRLASGGLTHRVPRVPVLVDGTFLKDPQDIRKYNGRRLSCTPLRTRSGVVLAAFTEWGAMISEASKMEAALAEASGAPTESICQSPPDELPDDVIFYENSNAEGDQLSLPKASVISNLFFQRRGFGDLESWDKTISSASWCRWDVALFEDSDFKGSSILLRKGCTTPDLSVFAWNDRASSVFNLGDLL